jgi:hypothetical protein
LQGAQNGTQTAALCFGGGTPGAITTATEEYDGTSWTTSRKFKHRKIILAGAGTTNSCFSFWR